MSHSIKERGTAGFTSAEVEQIAAHRAGCIMLGREQPVVEIARNWIFPGGRLRELALDYIN
jgi:hypothetical protein